MEKRLSPLRIYRIQNFLATEILISLEDNVQIFYIRTKFIRTISLKLVSKNNNKLKTFRACLVQK